MSWHQAMPERWQRERALASELLTEVDAGVDDTGKAYIRGLFALYSIYGSLYDSVRLRLVYPPTFPSRNQGPSVYLESHQNRWEKGGDSHIENDWRLCLYVPVESGITFASDSSLRDLFAVVHTFLLKERIYQRRLAHAKILGGRAKWPGPDRSHGTEGIREAVREVGGVGRNSPCPCGSGEKFKQCCKNRLEK